MTRKLHIRLLQGAVAAMALTVAACETPAPPEPVVVAPAPVAPPIAVAPRIAELASVYQAYVRQVSNISPAFNNGATVHASLRQGAAYEPKQLASGQVAYGAVIALQDPTFVAAVREFAVDPATRARVRDSILADPAYAVGFKGSDSAAGLIVPALNGEGSRVRSVGELVKQAAYSVQHQAWSKATVPTPELRLQEAKTLSITALQPVTADAERLSAAALGQAPLGLTGTALPPPYTPTVIRALAVAALAALGEAGPENAQVIETMMDEPVAGSCLRMSKLNLYQCLSVAKPWYEDVFCLGQHILIDTGQCMTRSAGELPKPTLIPTVTTPTTPIAPQTPIPAQSTSLGRPVTAVDTAPAPVAVSAEAAAKPAIAVER